MRKKEKLSIEISNLKNEKRILEEEIEELKLQECKMLPKNNPEEVVKNGIKKLYDEEIDNYYKSKAKIKELKKHKISNFCIGCIPILVSLAFAAASFGVAYQIDKKEPGSLDKYHGTIKHYAVTYINSDTKKWENEFAVDKEIKDTYVYIEIPMGNDLETTYTNSTELQFSNAYNMEITDAINMDPEDFYEETKGKNYTKNISYNPDLEKAKLTIVRPVIAKEEYVLSDTPKEGLSTPNIRKVKIFSISSITSGCLNGLIKMSKAFKNRAEYKNEKANLKINKEKVKYLKKRKRR